MVAAGAEPVPVPVPEPLERDEPLPGPTTVVEVELTPPTGIEVVMLVTTELTLAPGMPMDI